MSYVDQKLSRNRRILASVLGNKPQVKTSWDYLSGAGYDHRFVTHSSKSNNTRHFFIYEYLLDVSDSGEYTIAKVSLKHLEQ